MNYLGMMMGFVTAGALFIGSTGCVMSSGDDTDGISIDAPLRQPQEGPAGGGTNGCPELTDAQFMTYYNSSQSIGDGSGNVRQWADDAYVNNNDWEKILTYLVRVSSQSNLYSGALGYTLPGEHQLNNVNEALTPAPSYMKLVVGAEVAGFINNQTGVHVAMLHPEAHNLLGGLLYSVATPPSPSTLRWKQSALVPEANAYKWELGIRMKVMNINGVDKPVRAAWVPLDQWSAHCPGVPAGEIELAIKKRMCGTDPARCEYNYVFNANTECQIPNSSELNWVECTHASLNLVEAFTTGPALVTMIPDSSWPDQYDMPSGCSF